MPAQCGSDHIDPGHIAARAIEPCHQTEPKWIPAADENDRNSPGHRFDRERGRRPAARDNQRNLTAHQIGRQLGYQIVLPLGPAKVDVDVLTLHISGFSQPVAKSGDQVGERPGRAAVQKSNYR